jgi:hypothetical protein
MHRDPVLARVALLLVLAATPALAGSRKDAAGGVAGGSPPPAPIEVPTFEERKVRLSPDMGQDADLLLEGSYAVGEVVFPLPAAWELVEDPVLELHIERSAALDASRSHLTVALNDQPLRSVVLDSAFEANGTVRLPLARGALQAWNRVAVRVVQHLPGSCEDPFDPALWTRVRRDSGVVFRYTRPTLGDAAHPLDLGAFPYPFFDESGYGPARVALALGDRPSAAVVSGAGRMALSLGRLAGYRRVEVADPVAALQDATTHVLALGLPAENPVVAELLGRAEIPAGEGLVALRPDPYDPRLAVLVVTGGDEAGLGRAINAVAGRNRREVLSGTDARVRVATDATPPSNRQLPRPAPPSEAFDLLDLGLDDRTVRGLHTPAIRIPLGLEGDARVRPVGARFEVHFAHAAGLDPRRSTMEVRLDDVTVRGVPLVAAEGTTRATATIELPGELVRPGSVLDVRFHLVPSDYDACTWTSDRDPWATVYASSELSLPRDHVAELPDLTRLRNGGWPFTMEPEAGPVIVALPDVPSPADVSAGFAMVTELARLGTSDTPALRMAPAPEVPLDGNPGSHFVLVGTHTAHAALASLRRRGATGLDATEDGRLHVRDVHGPVLDQATRAGGWAYVEEVLHPGNPARAVLTVRAADATLLPKAVALVSDPKHVTALTGTAAMMDASGSVRTLTLHAPTRVGRPALGALMLEGAREHWLLVGVALVGSAFFLAALRRAWARTRGGG